MIHNVTKQIAGRELTIETGKLANQAGGAVTIRYGDTMVLVTACASPTARDGVDFLPLTIDYEERLYAAGKIPGSFFKREGRSTETGTLAARLSDRPLRPLFPKGFHNEVQVIVTVLSADQENDADILGVIGASCALSISEVPFEGPVGATRVGYVDGDLVINPTFSQIEQSDLDLVVAGTKNAIAMVEAGASEVSEEIIIQAVKKAQETNEEIIQLQEEIIKVAAKKKMDLPVESPMDPQLIAKLTDLVGDNLKKTIFTSAEKGEKDSAIGDLNSQVTASLSEEYSEQEVAEAFESLMTNEVRSGIVY